MNADVQAPLGPPCADVIGEVCKGFRSHRTRVLCWDGVHGTGHPATRGIARCLADGTHVCPRCDPTWPHATSQKRRALLDRNRPHHPANARLLRDEDPEKDGAL